MPRSEADIVRPFPAPRRRFLLKAGTQKIVLGERTLVMGVLNCTPDSFSDGGLHAGPTAISRRLAEMAEEGADWIDIGGESSRPGADPVPVEEEWQRVAPAFREARRTGLGNPLSIDTTKAEVARRAIEEGATLINDISALRFDAAMVDVARRTGAGVVLMHMLGTPRTMQDEPRYEDVVAAVAGFLEEAAASTEAAGVERERILIDPGIGFGKTTSHNLELLRRLPELGALDHPLLVGASRKSFLGRVLDLPVGERLEGSVASHTAGASTPSALPSGRCELQMPYAGASRYDRGARSEIPTRPGASPEPMTCSPGT
jgi:dihydropteroate synthase